MLVELYMKEFWNYETNKGIVIFLPLESMPLHGSTWQYWSCFLPPYHSSDVEDSHTTNSVGGSVMFA